MKTICPIHCEGYDLTTFQGEKNLIRTAYISFKIILWIRYIQSVCNLFLPLSHYILNVFFGKLKLYLKNQMHCKYFTVLKKSLLCIFLSYETWKLPSELAFQLYNYGLNLNTVGAYLGNHCCSGGKKKFPTKMAVGGIWQLYWVKGECVHLCVQPNPNQFPHPNTSESTKCCILQGGSWLSSQKRGTFMVCSVFCQIYCMCAASMHVASLRCHVAAAIIMHIVECVKYILLDVKYTFAYCGTCFYVACWGALLAGIMLQFLLVNYVLWHRSNIQSIAAFMWSTMVSIVCCMSSMCLLACEIHVTSSGMWDICMFVTCGILQYISAGFYTGISHL